MIRKVSAGCNWFIGDSQLKSLCLPHKSYNDEIRSIDLICFNLIEQVSGAIAILFEDLQNQSKVGYIIII